MGAKRFLVCGAAAAVLGVVVTAADAMKPPGPLPALTPLPAPPAAAAPATFAEPPLAVPVPDVVPVGHAEPAAERRRF